jgi:Fe-S oxidoreductase
MTEHKPSAVEIMDKDLIMQARGNPSSARQCGWMEGDPQGILIVEFFGESPEEAVGKANTLVHDLTEKKIGYAWPVISDPAKQAEVWAVRKNGLGLLMRIKGEGKPIGFIEDAAVPLEHLPDYILGIQAYCKQAEVPIIMYAHASVGLIHVRPVLNLKKREDIEKMKAIARHSFELVKKYKGSISGEHGDGRTRSPFLKEYFGPRVYNALKEVKQLFDPDGIMNPGIITDPGPMDANLRYGEDYEFPDIPTVYHYREEEGIAAAIESCSGVGVCRQSLSGLMCPSYRATRDEEHSTRGRANALRMAITGQAGEGGMNSQRLFDIMDLCLSCKGCKSECPTNVDVAKLKSEFLQKYREKNGTPMRDRFVSLSTSMAKRFSGWKAPLVNGVQKTMLFRYLLEKSYGIDRRRVLPSYARTRFHRWFDNRGKTSGKDMDSRVSMQNPGNRKKVVLFDDTYMNFHQVKVGISAVELLESCGYEVIPARAGCCQRPSISHGFLAKAKKEGTKTLQNLKKFIDEGLQVVVCEPGCASALTDDLPDMADDPELGRTIRENVMMIDVFLEQEINSGQIQTEFKSPFDKLMIHGHCHQKSLYGTTAMERILSRIPSLEVEVIDSGCCGMAGSFGYEKEHYDLSMKVGEDRLFPAIRGRKDGTGLVACGFSCRHQIKDATGTDSLHWVEVLRGSL